MVHLRIPFSDDTDLTLVRSQARRVLGRLPNPDVVDDTLLVITELVENVMQHTGDGGELVVRYDGDAVRVEVADTSTKLPRQYPADHRRIGGRGLLLVAAMTRSWGSRTREGGKVVWAEVPLSR